MEGDEVAIFVMAMVAAACAAPFALGWLVHRLYFKGNAAAGVPILVVAACMAWVGFVLQNYADPSVKGIYAVFYFLIGLAIVVGPAFWVPAIYGLRISVDVFQRKNLAVALVIGAFVLSTGLIYGGSLWGEADAEGDDEGGWWIPLGFFSVAWALLILLATIYIRSESYSLRIRLVQDRSLSEARAAAGFLIGVAIVLTDAVAGNFEGWLKGMAGLGTIALMMITHELFRMSVPAILTTVETKSQGWLESRRWESFVYLGLAVLFWAGQFLVRKWELI